MTRKKVNLAWIANDSDRKVCFKKRRDGLSKKVNELSILCNVSAVIIIYSPDDTEPKTWPIPSEVQEILERFNNMPELERTRKMINQETYLQQRVSKLDEKFKMLQRKNNERDGSNLMHYFDQGNSLDRLSETELETLIWFVDKKHKEIKRNTASYEQTHVSHNSFPLAPPLPLLALTYDQDPMLVPDRMAHTNRNDTIEFNDNHHGKAIPESNWRPWFNEMMNNIDNVTISVTDHMAESSASYQPSVGIRNYKSNFGGSSGDETTVGMHPYGDFKDLISTSGTNNPIMPPPMPLLPHVGDSFSRTNYPMGLQPYHGGFESLERILQNDMTIAHPPLHFEGNNNGSDIAQGLQPYKNKETGGSVSGGNLGTPSEFSGNLATGDVGLPYDVTKQWHSDFSP
ncbi:hypothetical protein LWI28_005054 [Acer negundo]|uniref:MADS-box domain-containing protein n=1 Tax=Acer negundo TaxID=4023 RepID=A0AAD5I988_ACENE|nr:hypothetical protein LWI28_005054 [Acer negundo]